jgi:glucose-6-phosphate-specific signal transduction histidine kinase
MYYIAQLHCITVSLSCQMTQFKNNYILQIVHFLIMNKFQFLHHSISAHFVYRSDLCMHVLKFTLILHLCIYCSHSFVAIFFFTKEYRISIAASCIEYSLILVKLV